MSTVQADTDRPAKERRYIALDALESVLANLAGIDEFAEPFETAGVSIDALSIENHRELDLELFPGEDYELNPRWAPVSAQATLQAARLFAVLADNQEYLRSESSRFMMMAAAKFRAADEGSHGDD